MPLPGSYKLRENILDIIDSWGGYPLKNPCSEDPAYNAGHVQLRCYINNTCPFYKTPKKEDTLVFNTETIGAIEEALPEGMKSVLTTTPGLDGIHFKPRQVFRHNYIYQRKIMQTSTGIFLPSGSGSLRELFEDFNRHFEDITKSGKTFSSIGADKTRYIAEQTWVIRENIFYRQEENEPEWIYSDLSVSESAVTFKDLKYDYQNDPGSGNRWKNGGFYDQYLASFEDDKTTLKPGNTLTLKPSTVQMPVQTKTVGDNGFGVHWRLLKRTPVFRGEDFFIRFYKQSKKPVTNNYLISSISATRFAEEYYYPLDITNDDTVLIDPDSDFVIKANNAVRMPQGSVDEDDNLNIYDFFNQSYYIIEINPYDYYTNYFIVIPQRGYPTFIHFYNLPGTTGTYSRKLGTPFTGVTGEQLIRAEWFDVIVRNHLGNLVIQFKGDFAEVPPWIVRRTDQIYEINEDSNGNKFYVLSETNTPLFIPRGRLGLWGGNITCGFSFSPLQYYGGYLSMKLPPREIDLRDSSQSDFANAFTGDPTEVEYSSGYFKSNPMWLPLNGTGDGTNTSHHLRFDADENEQGGGGVGSWQPIFPSVNMFTQDAEFYRNYTEDSDSDESYQYGFFYRNYPLRDASDHSGGGSLPVRHVKSSRLVARKNRFVNDEKTRHQGFDVLVGIMCGDHVFTDAYWISGAPSYYEDTLDAVENSVGDLSDSAWCVPECKTPVLTFLRLVSDVGQEPRWDDGTQIDDGVNRDPFYGTSNYYIDATDHVMSFTHSWTASGFTSMEHTGTIQFYLNYDMAAEKNVTGELFALQDKNFYIEIWAGYDPYSTSPTAITDACNYTRIPGFYKMFTGVCNGGSISYEYGKIVMTCRLEDYTTVLKGMKFFNSPWFDGLKDTIAINEILTMAGFRDQGVYDPGRLMRDLAQEALTIDLQIWHMHFDGRMYRHEPFALPSGYNRLLQPALKFNDGESLMEAVLKIARMSAKMFYFDEFGIAHYEDFQDIIEQDFLGGTPLIPLYNFTTNPEMAGGQLVFNKVERSFDVAGIYNHIKVLTNTPEMHLLVKDHIKWDSLENPEIMGFLGYQVTAFQQEGLFGSKEALLQTVNKYKVGLKPKTKMKFETYGVPLRPTDIIAFEGDPLRVMKVSHSFDPSVNRWWMQIECERYQPITPTTTVGT